MKYIKRIIFFMLLLLSLQLFSQEVEEVDPMPVKLKAQVLNLEDMSPVPFATITNFRTHGGAIANEQGQFTMDALNVDSLCISSVGFQKITVRIPFDYNEMNRHIFYVKPIRFNIPDVTVTAEKQKVNLHGVPPAKKIDIDPQLRGDAYNKKPPVVAAFFNPASYLQYYVSKTERDKRETRKAMITDKQWEVLSQYYNKALVIELTGLSDSVADALMVYINSKGLLNHMSTEYDVRNVIKEQNEIFQKKVY